MRRLENMLKNVLKKFLTVNLVEAKMHPGTLLPVTGPKKGPGPKKGEKGLALKKHCTLCHSKP